MKRILFILVSFVLIFGLDVNAKTYDYIYLNNGNVVKGKIINKSSENNATVTIKSVNGDTLTYRKSEIRKIGEAPIIPSIDNSEGGLDYDYKDYSKYDKGFWCSVETNGGYSMNLDDANIGFVDLDVVGGYRFNEYLRMGIGFGARYYINNDSYRRDKADWGFPLFLNIRGNIISSKHRSVVPFYSFDIGGTCRDGFMMRPTIGMRIGEPRSAFILGLSYMGQSVKSFDYKDDKVISKDKYTSFIALKIGYEF